MKKLTLLTILASILIMLPILSYADVIHFKDGEELTGEIIEVSDSEIVLERTIGKYNILIEKIAKIVFIENTEEDDPDYIEQRQNIKSQLNTLIEDNPDIELVIQSKEDIDDEDDVINKEGEENNSEENEEDSEETKKFIDVSYDDYNMDNPKHIVDGINLKKFYYYYSYLPKDKPKDSVYVTTENYPYYRKVSGLIIDADQLRIKIKTKSGDETYAVSDLKQVVLDIRGKTPKHRILLRNMLKYYNEQMYSNITYIEYDNKFESRVYLGICFKFRYLDLPRYETGLLMGEGFNFGVRIVKGLFIYLHSSIHPDNWLIADLGIEYKLPFFVYRQNRLSYPFFFSVKVGGFYCNGGEHDSYEHLGGISLSFVLSLMGYYISFNPRFPFTKDTSPETNFNLVLGFDFHF